MKLIKAFCILFAVVNSLCCAAEVSVDDAIECGSCIAWNQPQKPFRIFGNTYYVGTSELTVLLIADADGLIVIDGALPQSVPLIDANIRALGFRTEDIKLILNSHTHYDHAGGIAALQRATGAVVAASASAAAALKAGGPTADDPQYQSPDNRFPKVDQVQTIGDGEELTVGTTKITALFTPGHTPGGTTWTWQSCESDSCLNMVYADSLTPISADGFRFSGDDSTPSIVESFENSIRLVGNLPCDVFFSPHPGFFRMQEKVQAMVVGENNPFIEPGACRDYANTAMIRLKTRIDTEKQ